MDFEKVGLRVEKAPCFDGLIGVEVVFFSEFCEGELVLVSGDPAVEGRNWYFDFVFPAHGAYRHVVGVALIVICQCCEDDFWRVGCFWELAV